MIWEMEKICKEVIELSLHMMKAVPWLRQLTDFH
jgi:hypothetical protein